MPRPLDAFACGSMSTTSVRCSETASEAPRLMAVVVFPTPPFWLAMAMTRDMSALRWGAGSGGSEGGGEYTKPCRDRKSEGVDAPPVGPDSRLPPPLHMGTAQAMTRSRSARSRELLTVAFVLLATALGCSGGEPIGPEQSVEFLVGNWDAERFTVKSKSNPEVAPELIGGLGASFSVNVQPSGAYTAILTYQGSPFTEIGTITVEGNEIVFHVSFPAGDTNRSRFTLTEPRLVLVGDTEFDFDLNGQDEPAEAIIELRRR